MSLQRSAFIVQSSFVHSLRPCWTVFLNSLQGVIVLLNAAVLIRTSIMSTSMSWSFRRTLIAVIVMVVTAFHVSSQADFPKRHRGPCEIHYPSDATLEWDCRVIPPGESLETIFGEYWVGVARFNRIDRRHAHSGVSIKVPRRLADLAQFTPLPLVYPPGEMKEKFILIDLAEQFLGAYEFGALRFSTPIVSGNALNETPTGKFRLTAAHLQHQSDLYTIEGTDRLYPMNYALRFHVNREGVSYWIHGRDLPGRVHRPLR